LPATIPLAALADPLAGWQMGVGVEAFAWEETVAGVTPSPREQGARMTLNLSWKQEREAGAPYFAYVGKVYGGTVDYRTQTMSGIPSPTSTDYVGMVNEVRGIIPAGIVSGVIGGGYDSWSRSIANTVTSGGLYVQGYTEKFDIFFLRLGLAATLRDKVEISAGIKNTLRNSEELPYSLGTIHPGTSVSPYLDIGYHHSSNFGVAAYFDSWRFGESTVSGTGFYQPASRMSVLGVRAGWTF
jgi:hypothetical protein